MAKVNYGSVLKMCWKQYSYFQRANPTASVEEIYDNIHTRYEIAYNNDPENYSKFASLRAWELWLSDFRKEFLHVFFLETKLKEVLENIKIKVDNVKEFVRQNGRSELMWNDTYRGNIDVKVFCFAVHLPNMKHGFAFKLMLYDDMLITFCVKDDVGGFEITNDDYEIFLKSNDKNAQRKVKNFQLCVNTILYMDCYPECIVDGIPANMNPSERRENEKTCRVSVSKDFDEIIKSGGVKSPYMKGMYFMTFRDERYTKMRGKTITVKARFIKGKAVSAKTADDFSRLELKHGACDEAPQPAL